MKCEGKSVKPGQISTGERNAIALCYFFSKLREGKDVLNTSKASDLIIIDDPISSFDYENKIGILSYLKFEINNLFSQDSENKLLLMTHDLQTLFDIDKFIGEIYKKIKNKDYKVSELIDLKIHGLNLNKRKQYSNLMNMIFDYANTDNKEDVSYLEPFIGNVMRKVMEAYSTFNYRMGFAELFTSDNILNMIDNEYRKYFKNFMSRLVLNNESHYENAIASNEVNIDFFKYVSNEEKNRTARHIICFLFLLDKQHVLSYLNGKSNAEDRINQWIDEIPKNSI